MSKPNRVLAYLPKDPFECDSTWLNDIDAGKRRSELKTEGFDTKITIARVGSRKKSRIIYRVWKR